MSDKLTAKQISPTGGHNKKDYQAPKLEVFGSAAELTKGVGGSVFDPGHGNNAKHGVG